MIKDVTTSKGTAAITSDRWHVVLARFVGSKRRLPFAREIVSEHDDRAASGRAAGTLRSTLNADGAAVPVLQQDEVFVCKPNFKTLKHARRRKTRPPAP